MMLRNSFQSRKTNKLSRSILRIAAVAAVAAKLSTSVSADSQLFVIGGDHPSNDEAPPFVVAIAKREYQKPTEAFCTGVLIGDQWVLTAAHCANEGIFPSSLEVWHGSTELSKMPTKVSVQEIVRHHDWANKAGGQADIALLRLEEPIEGISYPLIPVSPIEEIGTANIAGWGATSHDETSLSNRLKIGEVDLYTKEGLINNGIISELPHQDYLVAGRDNPLTKAFSGDSGGPLYRKTKDGEWTLLGITSFGLRDCEGAGSHLSFFTRSDSFRDWVEMIQAPPKMTNLQIAESLLDRNETTIKNIGGEMMILKEAYPLLDDLTFEAEKLVQHPLISALFEWHARDNLDRFFIDGSKWYWSQSISKDYPPYIYRHSYTPTPKRDVRYAIQRSLSGNRIEFGLESEELIYWIDLIGLGNKLKYNAALRYANARIFRWKKEGFSAFESVEPVFVADEQYNYTAILQPTDSQYHFDIRVQEAEPKLLTISTASTGELHPGSSQLAEGFSYDSYKPPAGYQQEFIVEVKADFDIALRTFGKYTQGQSNWFDSFDDSTGEVLIMSPNVNDSESLIIQNQNTGEYGAYTLSLSINTQNNFVRGFGKWHRAITTVDSYEDVEGEAVTFEVLRLSGFQNNSQVRIDLLGKDGPTPAMAIFVDNNDEPLDEAEETFCERGTHIEFDYNEEKNYSLIVAQSDRIINRNYWIQVSDARVFSDKQETNKANYAASLRLKNNTFWKAFLKKVVRHPALQPINEKELRK